jgi:hypothetical protein
MSQNFYQAPEAPTFLPAHRPFRSVQLRVAFVGSIVLVLLGLAIAGRHSSGAECRHGRLESSSRAFERLSSL